MKGEEAGLGGGGGSAGAVGVGALAGDAVAVQGFFGEEIECLGRETEFVLRDWQAVAMAFHGGCWFHEALTGNEIESVFAGALYLAFDGNREPVDLDVARILTEFVPLSKLMAEQVTGLRNCAKGRARLATSAQEVGGGLRRIAA